MPLQGPLGLRDGHWKTALRRLDCSAPDVGLVDAIARVDIKVTKVGAGILSNLAIHAWVCVMSGRVVMKVVGRSRPVKRSFLSSALVMSCSRLVLVLVCPDYPE